MSEAFDDPVEFDESNYGSKRKGIRSRGAAGKLAVLAF
jgi:transposase-like protein